MGSLPASPGGRGIMAKPPEASGHRGACLQSCQVPSVQLPDKRHPLSPPHSPFPRPGARAGTKGACAVQPRSRPGRLLSRQTALNHRAGPQEPSRPETQVPTGQRACTHTHSLTQTHTRGLTHTHSMQWLLKPRYFLPLNLLAQILYYSIKCLSKFSRYPEKVLSFSKYSKLKLTA